MDGRGERVAATGDRAERGRVPARFGSEAQCRAALFALRWGKGWVCPACGHGRCAELKTRALYSCNRCKHQVGLTAGTVFHWTKLPLTTWFLAIYHLTQSKGGMSSVELARRLGTRQPTAWLMKHKLMAAMEQRDAGKPKLAGPGRGRRRLSRRRAPGRQARPGCGRQDAVRGRGGDDGGAQAQTAAADGRQGLPQEGDRDAGQARLRRRQQRRHRRPVAAGRRSSRPAATTSRWSPARGRRRPSGCPFTWVNTALGNIKTALAGTYHHVSAKHAQRYLASFAWRFNRRYQLDTLTERLAYACARTAPHPYRVIIAG